LIEKNEVRYPSKVPQRTYAAILEDQLAQLESDEQMRAAALARDRLSSDPYRPRYHFVNPEGHLNDPNGLCCWKGRWHLFYQAYPIVDPRQHWGHALSDDLVRWRDLPLAIHPGIEECCYSGSTLVEDDRVIAMYQGKEAGNMVAVARDPLLLNWAKIPGNPVIPCVSMDQNQRPYQVFDPCIWREEDGYYSLSGTWWDGRAGIDSKLVMHIFFSQDLRRWIYLGPFVEGSFYTDPGEDGVVPYFWPFGEQHILIFASHLRGSQYFIGEYDRIHHRFAPQSHGRFNHGAIRWGGVHAPSATPDGNGGCFVIHNINEGKTPEGWDMIMSVASRLTPQPDTGLGIEPVAALESLRSAHAHVDAMALPANTEIVLKGVAGNALELELEIEPRGAREVCLKVLRSANGEEHTDIRLWRRADIREVVWGRRKDSLCIDTTRSSLLPDVFARPPEVGPLALGEDEPVKLRVFVDRSVVEVFANGRQFMALRAYPMRKDSVGVSLLAVGQDAVLHHLDAWQMASIW
jgi:beta-fructofuranosidase